jgi:hypothetical protein
LLEAAQQELQEIRQYLTRRDVIWKSFWHRNERGVLKPYWRLRHRQSFHDGVCLAQLLVAVRQTLNEKRKEEEKKKKEEKASSTKANQLPHAQKVLRIATTIAGDSSHIAGLLGIQRWPGKRSGPENQPGPKKRSMVRRRRTRRWPRQYSTPSWPAAYNLACVYAAICAHHNRRLEAYMRNPEDKHKADKTRHELECFVGKVVTSLEFAITNPECEMERPSEWIANDPDFDCLRSPGDQFSKFRSFLDAQKQRDYPPSDAEHDFQALRKHHTVLLTPSRGRRP